jgi:hypothetical protein
MKIDALKEKVRALEKTLLAIDELSNVCQEAICHGNKPIDLEHCANILHYLIEPAMYQVEAVRMFIDASSHTAPSTQLPESPCS